MRTLLGRPLVASNALSGKKRTPMRGHRHHCRFVLATLLYQPDGGREVGFDHGLHLVLDLPAALPVRRASRKLAPHHRPLFLQVSGRLDDINGSFSVLHLSLAATSTFPSCPDCFIHIFITNRVINFAAYTNLITDGNRGQGLPKGKFYASCICDSVYGA